PGGARLRAPAGARVALGSAEEALPKRGLADPVRPGDELLARLELAGEEHLKIDVGALRAGGCERGSKPARLLLIALATAREDFGGGRPLRRRKQRTLRHLAVDALDGVVGADAERPAERCDGPLDATALLDPRA